MGRSGMGGQKGEDKIREDIGDDKKRVRLKFDSLGRELRDGSSDTLMIFQMRPNALSWNKSCPHDSVRFN